MMDPRESRRMETEGLRLVPVTAQTCQTTRIPVVIVEKIVTSDLQRPPVWLKAIRPPDKTGR